MSKVYVVNSSSKPISSWTQGDLECGGYVQLPITYEDEISFFGTTPTPSLALSSDFLACSDAGDALDGDKEVYELLQYLDATTMRTPGEESPVNDFVVALLRALNFAPKGAMIRTQKDFLFRTPNNVQHVKADVCILEGTDPLLIIQEDKLHLDPFYNVFVHLIATAVASFSADASYRKQYDILERRTDTIHGIIMNGSWPTFYKIPYLRTLAESITERPPWAHSIQIKAYRPTVPRSLQREREGMKPLDNRKIIISSFLRFKYLMFENAGKGMDYFSKL
jgi:hypothetical protein